MGASPEIASLLCCEAEGRNGEKTETPLAAADLRAPPFVEMIASPANTRHREALAVSPTHHPQLPMTISSLDDLLAEQLKDLYNSEDQIQSAYERWSDDAQSGDLKEMFDKHVRQSQGRRSDIENICDALGISPTGEKCAGTEGLVKEGDEFLEDSTDGAVRDAGLIANAQRVEHYGIAGYGCAATYARRLGHDDAARTLTDALTDAEELDERMTGLAERVLNPEAAEA
jgi:ferritin-like metal-binding protein YciE